MPLKTDHMFQNFSKNESYKENQLASSEFNVILCVIMYMLEENSS